MGHHENETAVSLDPVRPVDIARRGLRRLAVPRRRLAPLGTDPTPPELAAGVIGREGEAPRPGGWERLHHHRRNAGGAEQTGADPGTKRRGLEYCEYGGDRGV